MLSSARLDDTFIVEVPLLPLLLEQHETEIGNQFPPLSKGKKKQVAFGGGRGGECCRHNGTAHYIHIPLQR